MSEFFSTHVPRPMSLPPMKALSSVHTVGLRSPGPSPCRDVTGTVIFSFTTFRMWQFSQHSLDRNIFLFYYSKICFNNCEIPHADNSNKTEKCNTICFKDVPEKFIIATVRVCCQLQIILGSNYLFYGIYAGKL